MKTIAALSALLAALAVGTAAAQAGHPVKGSWSGYWGPSEAEKHRILMMLDWQNNEVIGTFNPGPNAVKVEKATLDADARSAHADARRRDRTLRNDR
jgi:spermidine/putrescine-binding protein